MDEFEKADKHRWSEYDLSPMGLLRGLGYLYYQLREDDRLDPKVSAKDFLELFDYGTLEDYDREKLKQ